VSVTNAPEAVAAEEAALVARIAAGDIGAPVAELYRRYGRRLYRFGVKHLGNEGLAEEMVQETFVRLWRTAGRFDAGKANVSTYLYVLARSAAADIYKRPSSRHPADFVGTPRRPAQQGPGLIPAPTLIIAIHGRPPRPDAGTGQAANCSARQRKRPASGDGAGPFT
jgi:RNA polymerase sigma factor (sigma-70 family)